MVDIVYLGPSDNLLLEEGGRAYHPGDLIELTPTQLGNLTLAGLRFGHLHSEPKPPARPAAAPRIEATKE